MYNFPPVIKLGFRQLDQQPLMIFGLAINHKSTNKNIGDTLTALAFTGIKIATKRNFNETFTKLTLL